MIGNAGRHVYKVVAIQACVWVCAEAGAEEDLGAAAAVQQGSV